MALEKDTREFRGVAGWAELTDGKLDETRPTNRVKPATDQQSGEIRKFETGATRDTDSNKHDPEGFLSPLVIDRFNEYMHANRKQRDGSVRDSDNWQKGIPKTAYMKSLWRHFFDVWLHHRGYGDKAKEPLEVALCGLLFNSMGYLHETLVRRNG